MTARNDECLKAVLEELDEAGVRCPENFRSAKGLSVPSLKRDIIPSIA
jgi:hypothetical protein